MPLWDAIALQRDRAILLLVKRIVEPVYTAERFRSGKSGTISLDLHDRSVAIEKDVCAQPASYGARHRGGAARKYPDLLSDRQQPGRLQHIRQQLNRGMGVRTHVTQRKILWQTLHYLVSG